MTSRRYDKLLKGLSPLSFDLELARVTKKLDLYWAQWNRIQLAKQSRRKK